MVSLISLLVVGASVQAAEIVEESALVSFREDIEAVFDEYCYDCHGFGTSKGGVTLDEFGSDAELRADPDLWLAVLNNVRKGIMPPSDELQPTLAEREQIARWIKDIAFGLDPAHPDPGRVTLRRLNRIEYRNTVRDLLGVDFDTENEFPADDSGHGFDNIADVLTVSPMLLEKYFDAAQQIIDEAVPQEPLVVAEAWIAGTEFESLVAIDESFEPEPETEEEGDYAEAVNEEARPDVEVWQAGEKLGDTLHLSYYHPARLGRTIRIKQAGDYEISFDMRLAEKYVDGRFDLNEAILVLKLNGEVVHERRLVREGYVPATAVIGRMLDPGQHELVVEIYPTLPAREKIRDLKIRLNHVIVRGPLACEHWVQPSEYADFFPRPVPASRAEQDDYRREILGDFARRAYRRPADPSMVNRLVAVARSVSDQPGSNFEKGVAQAMVAVLASPGFIFREEMAQVELAGLGVAPVDEFSLASRLSYFLWSSMPDAELMQLAGEGRLRENLGDQVRRMLADKRSEELVHNFTGQWLHARDIETVPIQAFNVFMRENPDPELNAAYKRLLELQLVDRPDRTEEQLQEMKALYKVVRAAYRADYPRLDGGLREAMQSETEDYFDYILREDRSVIELLDSDYTFVNEELAEHYDLQELGVTGEEMRRVTLPEGSVRGGVLTQGTLLAVTSNPTRTSPVKRGVFILENILGAPPPPPPPNIPGLEDAVSEEELMKLSLRETLALHASQPTCASCHQRMDPLGLALENFNALGKFRETELDLPIEPEGQLISGEKFADIRELKRILANERRDDFLHTLTEKMLTYALGRGMEYYDIVTIDQIVERLEANEFRMSALIGGIIESAPFQQTRVDASGLANMRRPPDDVTSSPVALSTPSSHDIPRRD